MEEEKIAEEKRLEELEALDGIKPATYEWQYYFSFTRDAPAPRNKYPYNHKHEYKKIKDGNVTEVWRRLKES